MQKPPENTARRAAGEDPGPDPPQDPWFLPAPPENGAPTDPPWRTAPRAPDLDAASWRRAEAAQYRALVEATQAVARFGERLQRFAPGIARRIALSSVVALLRAEGVWLSADRIALYAQSRIGGEAQARDLSRADWALRRLARPLDPLDGLHGFLGRIVAPGQASAPTGHATGAELEQLGAHWARAVAGAGDLHPLTRAGFALSQWRLLDISPPADMLEPTLAAMLIGAAGMAPFLPAAPGAGFAGQGGAGARLAAFYRASGAGALAALLELERLEAWQERATRETADLSGRIPGRLIAALLRYPVVSGELIAGAIGCSRVAARRNLALFGARGLIRETTGQSRYRFWTARI